MQERRAEKVEKCKKWNTDQNNKRLNRNLTRSEGNGAPEEKAKETELFSLKEKDQKRCEKQLPI